MKKLLGILAISALASGAFAQGLVGFLNNSAGYVTQWTSSTDPTPIRVAVGGGMVELLTAPAYTPFTALGTLSASGFSSPYSTLEAFLTANPGWQSVASVGFTTPAAGRFNGGTVTLQGAITGGANAEYVIIGWTGAATTWDAALTTAGTFFGTGPMTTTTTGSGGFLR